MPRKTSEETAIALMGKDIEYIKNSIKSINEKLDSDYVSRVEFEPIKKIVYGMVTLVLVTVFGAVIALVVTRK